MELALRTPPQWLPRTWGVRWSEVRGRRERSDRRDTSGTGHPVALASLSSKHAMPEIRSKQRDSVQPFNLTFQKNGQTAGTYPSNPGAVADKLLNLPTLM
jgi:hypothetical protein